MAAHIHAGALGRPVEEFARALNICAAEWRADPDNAWISGMTAAGWWICGHLNEPPMRHGGIAPATRSELSDELRRAGMVVYSRTPVDEDEARWANGVSRMLMYALGLSSELPMVPTGRVRAAS